MQEDVASTGNFTPLWYNYDHIPYCDYTSNAKQTLIRVLVFKYDKTKMHQLEELDGIKYNL